MSAQNVQIVRTLFDLWGTPQVNRAFELFHDDVVLELAYEMLGFTRVNRGHDAMRAFWSQWLSAWERIDIVHADFEAKDDRVLTTWTQHMRGRSGDVHMEQRFGAIWTLRDGKVAHTRYFKDDEAARAEFAR